MRIFFLDLDTDKQYKDFQSLKEAVPEASKHVCMMMLALVYFPRFLEFQKKMRDRYKIPESGFNTQKSLDIIFGNDKSVNLQSLTAEIHNEWHVTYWGQHASEIVSIILGNFITISIGSSKSIFFDYVKPSRIRDSSNYPALVFDPDRKISKDTIRKYVESNWDEIEAALNKSEDKNHDFSELNLEIYEIAETNPNLTHKEIAEEINKRHPHLSMSYGEIKSKLQDTRNSYDYFTYNRYYKEYRD